MERAMMQSVAFFSTFSARRTGKQISTYVPGPAQQNVTEVVVYTAKEENLEHEQYYLRCGGKKLTAVLPPYSPLSNSAAVVII